MYLLILLGLMVPATAFSDDDFSKEVEKETKLAPSLFLIEGAGGNVTASIGADGTLLVDADYAEMAGKLGEKLKQLGGEAPRVVINTHFHYDHTGGNAAFSPTALVVAATQVRDRLKTEQTLWGKKHPPVSEKALPTLTFESALTLHLNGEDIRAVHLPGGHTDGDTVVVFEKAHVIAMGDLYFSGMYPILHPEHGGSLEGLLHDIDWVLKEAPPDAKIIPGHGPLSTRAELARTREMILASIATVKRGIEKGLSLPQIQKAGLPSAFEPFSHGYRTTDQWLEEVFKSLSR
jgi:glyoxylase-like metal-dependent hydrolase (beta-lactamase superfamily II)